MISVIIYGLTIGGILYVVSIGLSLTFGTMRIVNFAHFLFYALGAYVLYSTVSATSSFFLGILAAVFLTIPLSYLVERFIIRRLYGGSIDYALISTYAIALIGVDAIKWIWGAQPLPLNPPIDTMVSFLGESFPIYRLIIIGTAILTFFGSEYFFRNTIAGKVVIAGLEDREGVRSLGVNVDKYFTYTFILGSSLGALGGALYAPIISVSPYMGFHILGLAFAVVIVGGLGNLRGTFYSALVLGLIIAITGKFWGAASEAMVYLVMAVVLLVRPRLKGDGGL